MRGDPGDESDVLLSNIDILSVADCTDRIMSLMCCFMGMLSCLNRGVSEIFI